MLSYIKWQGVFGVNFGYPKSEVFSFFGGVFGVNFGYPKSEVFSFFWGGEYSRVNFGHLKCEVFHLMGYFGVHFGHPKSEVFHGWGGFLVWNSRKGLSGEFGQKFTVQPETCLCITDSLSHTTYVETNQEILARNFYCLFRGFVSQRRSTPRVTTFWQKMRFPVFPEFSLCYINFPCVIFTQKLTISAINKDHITTVSLYTEAYKLIF